MTPGIAHYAPDYQASVVPEPAVVVEPAWDAVPVMSVSQRP